MKDNNINNKLVDTAAKSTSSDATLRASLEFTKVVDKLNTQHIASVVSSQKEISKLKVDNQALMDNIQNLKAEANTIYVVRDPFNGKQTVRLAVDDPTVKELVDEAKAKEIVELKEQIRQLNENIKENEHAYELGVIKANREKTNEIQSFRAALLAKEEVIRDKELAIRDKDHDIKKIRKAHSVVLEGVNSDYSSSMRATRSDYQEYKASFNDQLNNLKIEVNRANEEMEQLIKSVSNSWFFRTLRKSARDIIDSLSPIKYNISAQQR